METVWKGTTHKFRAKDQPRPKKAATSREMSIAAVVDLYRSKASRTTCVQCWECEPSSKKLAPCNFKNNRYKRKNIPEFYNEVLVYGHERKNKDHGVGLVQSGTGRPFHSKSPLFTMDTSSKDDSASRRHLNIVGLPMLKEPVQKRQSDLHVQQLSHLPFLKSSDNNQFQSRSIPYMSPISPTMDTIAHPHQPYTWSRPNNKLNFSSDSTGAARDHVYMYNDQVKSKVHAKPATEIAENHGNIKTESTSQMLMTRSKQLVIPKITVRTATPVSTDLVIPEITIRIATPLAVSADSTSVDLTEQFINRTKLSKELDCLKNDLKIIVHSIDTNT